MRPSRFPALSLARGLVLASVWIATLATVGCDNTPVPCGGGCIEGREACCPTATGEACLNVYTDPNNCGGCGVRCAGPCTMGVCTVPLDGGPRDAPFMPRDVPTGCSGTRTCGGVEVESCGFTGGEQDDGRTDPTFANCGICGRACDEMTASRCAVPMGGSGTPRCMCGVQICSGLEVCHFDGTIFYCVDTETDEMNCGSLGHRCAMGETCTGGACGCGTTGVACGAGESCCGGGCLPTSADDANCGGCGITCDAGETCIDSMCSCGGDVCEPPGTGPGGSLGELCCAGTCVAQDELNCGGCGIACDTADGDVCFRNTNPLFNRVCCGMRGPLPLFSTCSGGLPIDAGFPGEDAGIDAGEDAGELDAGM